MSLRDSDEVLVIRSCDGTEIARHTDVTEPTAAAVDHGQMFVSSFDTGAVHRGDEGVIFRDTWFLQEPVAMGWHEEVLWVLGRDGRHFVLLDADGTLLDLIGGPELDRTHDFVRASDDRLYVTTSWNAKTDGRIQVWDPYTRALVGDFGEDLELPIGIDEGPGGWLYVADWGRDRVERFTLDGTLDPSLSVEVAHPRGLAVTADGTIFVAGEEGVLVVPAGEDEATLVRAVRGAQSITVLDP
ncbi:MAG: hypothetical protein H6719_36935 [Sandaracinaceae bacterium]|nr:hypothetical protein [Sandaracinaceae bacterium]